jgi:protein required for attachment to host cells
MQTTWYIVADEHRARIFEVEGAQDDLHEIEDFVSPEGRMREQDMTSDAKGRYYGKGERFSAHTTEPNVSQTQHAQQLFAKEVCDYLDKAHADHRYDKLCVIAFSKFLGMLRDNMSKEARQLVEDEITKDISGLDEREIEAYIKARLH